MKHLPITKIFRCNTEIENVISELMKDNPEDYPNESSVLRAGVFSLKRWKEHDRKIVSSFK